MNFFEKIIHSLEGTMTTPTNYGWFHLMFIAIVLVVKGIVKDIIEIEENLAQKIRVYL